MSNTLSAPKLAFDKKPSSKHTAGFTRPEIIMAFTLSFVVIASSMVMFDKLEYRSGQYEEIERQKMICMESFGADTRSAKSIIWNSPTSITLAMGDDKIANTHGITYAYDAARQIVTRTQGDTHKVMVTGIDSFAFRAFMTGNKPIVINSTTLTTAAACTQQIQLSLSTRHPSSNTDPVHHSVVSARFDVGPAGSAKGSRGLAMVGGE